jgi:Phosphotransferase enzyme family
MTTPPFYPDELASQSIDEEQEESHEVIDIPEDTVVEDLNTSLKLLDVLEGEKYQQIENTDKIHQVMIERMGHDFPKPPENEPLPKTLVFDRLFERINVRALLSIALLARADHMMTCKFGTRYCSESYCVILPIIFSDKTEWIAKLPKDPPKAPLDEIAVENPFLATECDTLTFLNLHTKVPVPKVHSRCYNSRNDARTPYILMDKLKGFPLGYAIPKFNFGRAEIYRTLAGLAEIKKSLLQYDFHSIGGIKCHSHMEFAPCRYYDIRNYRKIVNGEDIEGDHPVKAFATPLEYYSNLHKNSWSRVFNYGVGKTSQNFNSEHQKMLLRQWKIHTYLARLLPSYVKELSSRRTYLAHLDLNPWNIFVDSKGYITGIIDWKTACTLPFEAAGHYPSLLDQDVFEKYLAFGFKNSDQELKHWREFYANQFDDVPKVKTFFKTIESRWAYEKILKGDLEYFDVSYLLETKLLKSAKQLDEIEVPFPPTEAEKASELLVSSKSPESSAGSTSSGGPKIPPIVKIPELPSPADSQQPAANRAPSHARSGLSESPTSSTSWTPPPPFGEKQMPSQSPLPSASQPSNDRDAHKTKRRLSIFGKRP